jgi:hypothetical protein
MSHTSREVHLDPDSLDNQGCRASRGCRRVLEGCRRDRVKRRNEVDSDRGSLVLEDSRRHLWAWE